MPITHTWSSVISELNGGSVLVAIPPSSVQANDVVIAFGGKPGRASADLGPPSTLGYNTIYTTGISGVGPNFWVGSKIMGATPDSSFVGLSSGNAADGTTYGLYIFRGVSSVVHDVPRTIATGANTSPQAPSIITVTNNAVLFIPALSQVMDTACFSVLGYSDFKFATANDSLDTTGLGNWASVATAGTATPGNYVGVGSGTPSWIAATVALRPAPEGQTNFQFNGTGNPHKFYSYRY